MTDAAAVLSRAGLDDLIAALIADGYKVIGPTVRDDAIVLAELTSGAQLPAGWGVDSGPGRYRLRRRADQAVFGHSAGPQSWKQFLHPPRQQLWSADADGFSPAREEPARYAFLGVRACDLAAIAKLARCWVAARIPAARSRDGGRACSWSRLAAPNQAASASARRWAPGRRRVRGYDLALTERTRPGSIGLSSKWAARPGSGSWIACRTARPPPRSWARRAQPWRRPRAGWAGRCPR